MACDHVHCQRRSTGIAATRARRVVAFAPRRSKTGGVSLPSFRRLVGHARLTFKLVPGAPVRRLQRALPDHIRESVGMIRLGFGSRT